MTDRVRHATDVQILRDSVDRASRPNVDLSVEMAGLQLPNPITTASGCFASGKEMDRFYDVSDLGAVVVKSVTLEPREGLPTPRMHETPSGMLNAIGLQNPGVDAWIARDLPFLVERGARVIVSIAGKRPEEFAEVASRLRGNIGVAAIEINLSCPNVEHRGLVFACIPDAAAQVVRAVRSVGPGVPLFAKLTPDVTDIGEIASAVMEAGASGISAINTTLGMAIDPATGRPRIFNTFGGLSGPAIRPMAVRAVHQVHRAVPEAPIIGMGGVRSVEDVVEMVRAGASMVAIGTAGFADPFLARRLVDELAYWCQANDVSRLADLRGRVQPWT